MRVDEFLAPHPMRFGTLADYVEQLAAPYVMAVGLNVFEIPDDPLLDLSGPPLLAQRRHGVREGAYCKTAVISTAVHWSGGFHNASVVPRFDDVYLFHMKYADIAGRMAWLERMVETCEPGEQSDQQGFLADLRSIGRRFADLPIARGWPAFDDPGFTHRFLKIVQAPSPGKTCFQQVWISNVTALEIPAAFGTPF